MHEVTPVDDRRALIGGGAGVFLVTLAFRAWGLGRPAVMVFDELYYTNDALDLVTRGVEHAFAGHPPLGKLLIGLGFILGDFSPVSWRLAAVVAGAVVVALAYAIGTRLSASPAIGVVAAALVFTDGVAYTTGRLALLDGFAAVATTALLAVLVFTFDRHITRVTVLVVGVLSGAALAVKWSTGPAVAVAVLVCAYRAHRQRGLGRAIKVGGAITLVALLAYTASYSGWFVGGASTENCERQACTASIVSRLAQFPEMQLDMFRAQVQLERYRAITSPGWRWVIQDRASTLFDEACYTQDAVCRDGGPSRVRVVSQGNPLLWMTALPLLLLWYGFRARRGGGTRGVGLVTVWALVLWLQFVPFSKTYTFYAAPIVPALAVAVAMAARDLVPRRLLPVVLSAGVVAASVLFFAGDIGLPWRT